MGRKQEPTGWDTPKIKRRLPRLDRSDWLAIAAGFLTAAIIIYLVGGR